MYCIRNQQMLETPLFVDRRAFRNNWIVALKVLGIRLEQLVRLVCSTVSIRLAQWHSHFTHHV